jgi:hypothetical protein
MPVPQPGDVLIRGIPADRFELVDAVSHAHIDGPFLRYATALLMAQSIKPRAIWHQHLDERGRPIGDLVRMPELKKDSN